MYSGISVFRYLPSLGRRARYFRTCRQDSKTHIGFGAGGGTLRGGTPDHAPDISPPHLLEGQGETCGDWRWRHWKGEIWRRVGSG